MVGVSIIVIDFTEGNVVAVNTAVIKNSAIILQSMLLWSVLRH